MKTQEVMIETAKIYHVQVTRKEEAQVGDIVKFEVIQHEPDNDMWTYDVLAVRLTLEDQGNVESGPNPYVGARTEYFGQDMGDFAKVPLQEKSAQWIQLDKNMRQSKKCYAEAANEFAKAMG